MSPDIAKHDVASHLPEPLRGLHAPAAQRLAVSLTTPRYANVGQVSSRVASARLVTVCAKARSAGLWVAPGLATALATVLASGVVAGLAAAIGGLASARRPASLEWLDDRQLRDIGLERIELPREARFRPLGY